MTDAQQRVTQTGKRGEASLELLVRIAVEKAHAHLRKGDWKLALEVYQQAENHLDYTADDGLHVLDPTRSTALRGTIIMFLGDVFVSVWGGVGVNFF